MFKFYILKQQIENDNRLYIRNKGQPIPKGLNFTYKFYFIGQYYMQFFKTLCQLLDTFSFLYFEIDTEIDTVVVFQSKNVVQN